MQRPLLSLETSSQRQSGWIVQNMRCRPWLLCYIQCGHSPQVDVAAVVVQHEGSAIFSCLWVGLLQNNNNMDGLH